MFTLQLHYVSSRNGCSSFNFQLTEFQLTLQMCHMHGVMHRDLKPENFLFGNKKETAPLKAIDFGLSVFFKPGNAISNDSVL